MNILQVVTSDFGGGAESSALNLFRSYRTRGHGSWLVVGHKVGTDPDVLPLPNDRYRNVVARAALALGRVVEEKTGPGAFRYFQILSQLTEPIRNYHRLRGHDARGYPGSEHLLATVPGARMMDVVHLHNLHGGYFDLGALPSISRQVPTLIDVRDMWLVTGHCGYSMNCGKWETGCGHCPDLRIYPRIWTDGTAANWRRRRLLFQQSRLYVSTPSRRMLDTFQRSGLECRRAQVVPNAIDLGVYFPGSQIEAREQLGLPKAARIVLFTAQSAFKDYGFMVRALERVRGEGKEQLLFVCLARTDADRTLGARLLIHRPFVKDLSVMAAYYRAADVFIHAAKHEVFGKTLVESQACGTPVVGVDEGGISETFVAGETGFLVQYTDPAEMASKVDVLLSDPGLRTRMGQAGIAHARARFGLERQTSDFLRYYGEMAEDFREASAHGRI